MHHKRIFLKLSLLNISLLLAADNASAQTAKLISRELIFEKPPFKECHASTIVELSKGKMLASWFAGPHESHPEVNIWTAEYENGKWTKPVERANGVESPTRRYACWNPVLFKTKEGKLFLFYKVGKSPREWWGEMITSTNDGTTWSKPEKLPAGMLGPIKNKPIQLANGDLLHPTSTESLDEKIWHIHLEKSDKDGKNWEKIAIENDSFSVIQPSILRYSPTKLQLLSRSRQNRVVQTWSDDNGKTWSPLTVTNLPNPNSGTDASTLKSGWQVLVYNPLKKGKNWDNGRNKLVVAVSKDGENWKDVYTLEEQPKGEFSYPSVVQSEDGLVHVTYTADRKSVSHVVLDIK
jgi:alpha-L-fucosidase